MATVCGLAISPELKAANERLLALRAKWQAQKAAGCSVAMVLATEPMGGDRPAIPIALPPHLGWGSMPLTAAIRAAQQSQLVGDESPPLVNLVEQAPPDVGESAKPIEQLTLYPQLALAILKAHREAAGRVWLLLRHIDSLGRGWLAVEEVRVKLTRPDSSLHICTWRQLRNLLKAGQGLFWELDEGRIWLRSLVRVANGLGVERLQNRPVTLPLPLLLGGIGDLRAHFYASFHSGRDKNELNEQGQCEPGRPIARATLQTLSGVGRCSQRNYEKRAKVQVRRNYAIGEAATDLNREQRAAEKGGATFELTDRKGKQGPKQKNYMAWQLPNSYSGPHFQESHSRKQRRINSQLADLRIERNVGNGRLGGEVGYYGNGKSAAKGFNRNSCRDCYFPTGRTKRRDQLWGVLTQR